MSQPKRFSHIAIYDVTYRAWDDKEDPKASDDGEFVFYSDYAALAAENERLRSQVGCDAIDREHGMCCDSSLQVARLTAEKEALVQQGIRDHGDWRSKLNFLETDYKAEVARLTAENERLRRAGDAVIIAYQVLIVEQPNLLRAINVAIGDWNAAKEGRDAK